jgi:hypothetical protein
MIHNNACNYWTDGNYCGDANTRRYIEAPQVSCRIVLSPGGCADAKEDRARGA